MESEFTISSIVGANTVQVTLLVGVDQRNKI